MSRILQLIRPDEKIHAAAVMTFPERVIFTMPKPYRHFNILHKFSDEIHSNSFEQGFITNKGRFLRRNHAFVVARERDQFIRTPDVPGKLYSEDVW